MALTARGEFIDGAALLTREGYHVQQTAPGRGLVLETGESVAGLPVPTPTPPLVIFHAVGLRDLEPRRYNAGMGHLELELAVSHDVAYRPAPTRRYQPLAAPALAAVAISHGAVGYSAIARSFFATARGPSVELRAAVALAEHRDHLRDVIQPEEARTHVAALLGLAETDLEEVLWS